jgi:hypothetical protein
MTSQLRLVGSEPHEPLPVRGTFRREKDGEPPDLPLQPWDFPILADCSPCGKPIRKDKLMLAEWHHTAEEAGFTDLIQPQRRQLGD